MRRLPAYASLCNRSAMPGQCNSKAGRGERIFGISRKLCRGGGDEVAHSRELPCPQGSSRSAGRPYFHDRNRLKRKGIVDAPRTNEKMVETVFSVVNPSLGR